MCYAYRFPFAWRYAFLFWGSYGGLDKFSGWWAFPFFQLHKNDVIIRFYLASPHVRMPPKSENLAYPAWYKLVPNTPSEITVSFKTVHKYLCDKSRSLRGAQMV